MRPQRVHAKTIFVLALLAAAASALSAQTSSVPRDWRAIVDRPRKLAFAVDTSKTADGAKWIVLVASYEVVLRAPLEAVAAANWRAYERSHEVFSRVYRSRVLSKSVDEIVTEQETGVKVLGLSFLSTAVFRNTRARPAPGRVEVEFSLVRSDGSLRASAGSYAFESIDGPEGPWTLVRYEVWTEVEARFPGQAGIMRTFGPADLEDVLEEFAREVYLVARSL
ncbi:MAG: hypothetical protein JXA15_09315 [Spirochaetales bacterium]|nr:hypothetical protein [Spirochaetales bacterium]